MKKTLLILAIALAGYCSYAQTNTFPSSGNVGIGTMSPNSILTIGSTDATAILSPGGSNTHLTLAAMGANGSVILKAGGVSNGALSTREVMRVDGTTGNVGIRTTTPRDKLDLSTDRGINLMIGDRGALGSILSSAATVIGQNVKADNSINNQMSYINTTTDGTSAIKLQYDQGITFHTNSVGGTAGAAFSSERLRITPTGNIGIGTTTPDAALAVNGTIHTKEVKVDLMSWPDYVFKSGYNLPSLTEIKIYIDKNQHLPEMPSESDVAKNGINLGEVVKLQTKKIEELTLYLIDQQKTNQSDKAQLQSQQEQINQQQENSKQQNQRIAALEAALSKLTPIK